MSFDWVGSGMEANYSFYTDIKQFYNGFMGGFKKVTNWVGKIAGWGETYSTLTGNVAGLAMSQSADWASKAVNAGIEVVDGLAQPAFNFLDDTFNKLYGISKQLTRNKNEPVLASIKKPEGFDKKMNEFLLKNNHQFSNDTFQDQIQKKEVIQPSQQKSQNTDRYGNVISNVLNSVQNSNTFGKLTSVM